ncbi:MAG: peptide chain release factor N(5)-glutamine methyltransferase [Thermoleophilia bacterium]|nr:peptide chain release factor N(5)-glutamine methyltransferase [Thermoleophilia bacterium]
MTVREALGSSRRELERAGCPSPRADAEHLVAHVLRSGRTELYATPERELTAGEAASLAALVARRAAREPLAYLLGEWGFRGLVLAVDARVLVPRPETEVVVEHALARLSCVERPRVLDVGTGSGAIALALASERSDARVVATDVSAAALAVAAENRSRLGLAERVELVQGDLAAGQEGPFDLVVSNPPYVLSADLGELDPEVRDFEPRLALVDEDQTGGIARAARELLRPGGWVVLECSDRRGDAVAALLRELGFARVSVSPDLAGRDRVVEGRKP